MIYVLITWVTVIIINVTGIMMNIIIKTIIFLNDDGNNTKDEFVIMMLIT